MNLEHKGRLLGDSIDQLKKFLENNSLFLDENGLYDDLQDILANLRSVYK